MTRPPVCRTAHGLSDLVADRTSDPPGCGTMPTVSCMPGPFTAAPISPGAHSHRSTASSSPVSRDGGESTTGGATLKDQRTCCGSKTQERNGSRGLKFSPKSLRVSWWTSEDSRSHLRSWFDASRTCRGKRSRSAPMLQSPSLTGVLCSRLSTAVLNARRIHRRRGSRLSGFATTPPPTPRQQPYGHSVKCSP